MANQLIADRRWRAFWRNRAAAVSLAVFAVIGAACFLSLPWSLESYDAQQLDLARKSPSQSPPMDSAIRGPPPIASGSPPGSTEPPAPRQARGLSLRSPQGHIPPAPVNPSDPFPTPARSTRASRSTDSCSRQIPTATDTKASDRFVWQARPWLIAAARALLLPRQKIPSPSPNLQKHGDCSEIFVPSVIRRTTR